MVGRAVAIALADVAESTGTHTSAIITGATLATGLRDLDGSVAAIDRPGIAVATFLMPR